MQSIITVLLLYSHTVYAQDWVWSVSPLLGIYSPQLGDLNDKEFRAPLPGVGGIVIDQAASESFSFTIHNPLPKIRFATEAGIEFQLQLDSKNSLLFGIGSWEGMSTSVIKTEIPFQGELSQVIYERSGRVSTTQYFLGYRRNLFIKNKRRLYARVTLNELMDVDYKEDLVFGFLSGPAEGFKRVFVTESQATGILMLQLGMGGEFFVRDWIALGFDVGYMKGIDGSRLGNISQKNDLQSGDSLALVQPAAEGPDGKLWYLSNDGSTYRRLYLDFDGWRALVRVNFYF
jgi:hypothetical protein